MTELSVQEKLLKLQAMGKMSYDNQPTFGEYLQLAMELADCKTKIADANKVIEGHVWQYEDEAVIMRVKEILSGNESK